MWAMHVPCPRSRRRLIESNASLLYPSHPPPLATVREKHACRVRSAQTAPVDGFSPAAQCVSSPHTHTHRRLVVGSSCHEEWGQLSSLRKAPSRFMGEPPNRLACVQASDAMRGLVGGTPAFPTEDYDPTLTDWSFGRVLVVGAGAIGSELLHLLALSGFASLTIIDMDTVELSNLNRQFLFRVGDIGKPKSTTAAAAVNRRCPGVHVEAVFGRIEDQPDDFYRQFHVIVMGVDSISARRWMNAKVADLARWELRHPPPGGAGGPSVYHIASAIPLIDTGTAGFQSHCRIVNMAGNATPCIECEMYLFEAGEKKAVPMCTLENIPRSPEHCVLYAQFKLWPDVHPGQALDGDNQHHIQWITERARARQLAFGIGGEPISEAFAFGVVTNVVPAVAFTNAMVAGQAVTEILKLLLGMAPSLRNYTFSNGSADSGVYFNTIELRPSPREHCHVCSPRPLVPVALDMTPQAVKEALVQVAPLSGQVADLLAADTLSLRIASSRTNIVTEVFLSFCEGSALAFPIVGTTVEDIFAHQHESVLLPVWRQAARDRLPAAPTAAEGLEVLVVCTLGGPGTTITLPVKCVVAAASPQ